MVQLLKNLEKACEGLAHGKGQYKYLPYLAIAGVKVLTQIVHTRGNVTLTKHTYIGCH